MKKSTFLSLFLITLMATWSSFGQKVVVIGMNHNSSSPNTDGLSFVATEDLPNGEVIYFTENEYSDAANAFTTANGGSASEGIVKFTAASIISKGTVVFINETGTSTNAFTVSCTTGGACGTAIIQGTNSFSLGTGGESLYAYSDTDGDPYNGFTAIYSVMFTGFSEGSNTQNGGFIPADQNPTNDFPTAVVVDGFPSVNPDRTEFKFSPATLRDGVSQVGLENPSNYLSAQSNQALSTVEFTNLNLLGTNPILTVTATPTSTNENSGTGMVYTFTLDTPAVGNLIANFSVGGNATLTSDYNATGATTFSGSTGTVTIANGTTTKTITITPIGDTNLEPDETVLLTITPGSGYDGGSPSAATVIILNDDTQTVTPNVAITGVTHSPPISPESFSFVILDDIATSSGTQIYFTENSFNNTLLNFSGSEGVAVWAAPAAGITRGQVIVATETSANVFTTTCDSGDCGTVTVVSGVFDFASSGEGLFAYHDTDNDPFNGISQIDAVLFTGISSTSGGGNIPANENPSGVYIGSILVDGFAAELTERTEYNPTLRGVDVDQANFQNTGNWLHSQPTGTLSTTPFTNIIISTGSANPIATVTISPNSVAEDSGTGMVYTFSLSTPATGDVTINYTVAGTAVFPSDYGQTGAATFDGATGTATILNGNNTTTVTITPIADIAVEPLETVILALASGTGYNGGSPNDATGSITNDDTSNSDPLVAVTGMNHVTPDGFSFVAAKDIPANTPIYFTENEFDNTTLKFSTGEGVMLYTSPGTIIPAGDVIVVKETSPDVFSLTCNGTNGAACGSITLISGNLAHDTAGESLYAYKDSDNDPSNGVDDIYAVLFTGLSASSGGLIPASENPSGIYLSAIVVDGFPASAPDRTEYKFAAGERALAVTQVDFEDINNWLHGQTNQDLSPIPFASIVIGNQPPTAICQNITLPLDAMGQAILTPTMVDNGSTDDSGTVFLGFESMSFSTETTTASPTDEYQADGQFYYYQESAFTVPIDGTYTFNMTSTSNVGNSTVIILYNDTPVHNSGFFTSRPEYLSIGEWQNDGTPIAPLSISLVAGTTYYMNIFDASPLGVATMITTINQPIITTAANPTFTCADIGDVTQTLQVFDPEGNTSSCTSTVTISDTILPVVTCQDITVELDNNGEYAITSANFIFDNIIVEASDNCDITTVIPTGPRNWNCSNIGINQTWIQVIDVNGNYSEKCYFNVTVTDTLKPEITCPLDQTQNGAPYIIPDYFATAEATATDNCTTPISNTTQDPAAGTELTLGIHTVTLTAQDAYGNTETCTFQLTVELPLGLEENQRVLNTVTMYPNPAQNQVYISNPNAVNLNQAQLYDLRGRLIETYHLKTMGTEKLFNISHLASATYLVIIKSDIGQITKRIHKK